MSILMSMLDSWMWNEKGIFQNVTKGKKKQVISFPIWPSTVPAQEGVSQEHSNSRLLYKSSTSNCTMAKHLEECSFFLGQVPSNWHHMLIQDLLDDILNMCDVCRCMIHVVMRLYAAIKVPV